VRKKPYAVILLDEIEKAPGRVQHPAANPRRRTAHDSYGRRVNFKEHHHHHDEQPRAKDIKRGLGLGFGRDDAESEYERIERMVREEVKKPSTRNS